MAPGQFGEWLEVVDIGSDDMVAVIAQEDDGRDVGAAAGPCGLEALRMFPGLPRAVQERVTAYFAKPVPLP